MTEALALEGLKMIMNSKYIFDGVSLGGQGYVFFPVNILEGCFIRAIS